MKGGINFEEWKEIVKKNRRSLRSKSNIFRFEPESLTYGGDGIPPRPTYTITYNVTGMEVPSNWPTKVREGQKIVLHVDPTQEGYGIYGVDINGTYDFENNNTITIHNIQGNTSIDFSYGEIPTMINLLLYDLTQAYSYTEFCIYDDTVNSQIPIDTIPADRYSMEKEIGVFPTHTYTIKGEGFGAIDENSHVDPVEMTFTGLLLIANNNIDLIERHWDYLTFALFQKDGWYDPGDYYTIRQLGLYADSNYINADIIYGATVDELNMVFRNYAEKYNKEYYLEAYKVTPVETKIRVRNSATDAIIDGNSGRNDITVFENETYATESYNHYDEIDKPILRVITSGYDDIWKIFDQSTILQSVVLNEETWEIGHNVNVNMVITTYTCPEFKVYY